MKTTVRLLLLAALLLVLGPEAWACSFDTDCQVGSKCVKKAGHIYGICMGGLQPGNTNDRVPVRDPLDPNRTVGNTCSFDTECGPGNICSKDRGAIKGACVRKPRQ